MLASTIIAAVAGALAAFGMFFAWYVRYARSEEHRLTALEERQRSLQYAVDGLIEESRKDADGARDFSSFVREELSVLRYKVERFEELLKDRR